MGRNILSFHRDIDRGWAWVVASACSTYNFLMGGTFKLYGIFYVEFLHIFPESPASVGLIGLSLGLTALVVAPFGGALSDAYSTRVLVMVSGCIMSASFACTSLAPNIWVAILTYGIIAGAILGLIDGPILASVGRYFRRKRNIASGMVWMGSSLGNLVLSPLFSYLIYEYSIRGMMVIFGGIWLHVCVVGALLLPAPADPERQRPLVDTDETTGHTVALSGVDRCRQGHGSIRRPGEASFLGADTGELGLDELKETEGSINSLGRNKTSSTEYNQTECGEQNVSALESNGSVRVGDGNETTEEGGVDSYCILPPSTGTDARHSLDISSSIASSDSHSRDKTIYEANGLLIHQDDVGETVRSDATCPKEEDRITRTNTNRPPLASLDANCTASNATERKGYIGFLSNGPLWHSLIVLGCGFYGYYVPFTSIPVWCEEMDVSKYEVAIIMSIIGFVEVASRLLMGVVIDACHLRSSHVLMSSYIVMALVGQIVSVLSGFWPLVAYACMHGMLGGVSMVLMATIVAECVSIERTGSAMGLVVVTLNLAAAVGSFTPGLAKELTNSYRHALQVSSGVYLLGAAVCLLGFYIPACKRQGPFRRATRCKGNTLLVQH